MCIPIHHVKICLIAFICKIFLLAGTRARTIIIYFCNFVSSLDPTCMSCRLRYNSKQLSRLFHISLQTITVVCRVDSYCFFLYFGINVEFYKFVCVNS